MAELTLSQFCGWVATICFSTCYIPQLVRTWRMKKVEDISVLQWVIQLIGYLSGIYYGVTLLQGPLIVGYLWGAFASIIFLIMYIKYKR